MKKSLCLLMITLILLSGCAKKVESEKPEVSNQENVQNPVDNDTNEDKTDEPTTKSTSTATTTTTKKTTKSTTKTTTSKKTTTKAKNIYKSVKTGKEHKYTFVYNDNATCRKKADADAFDIVNPTHPYVVFDCEEIESQDGKRLWGAFFYSAPDEASIFYY